MNSAQRIEDVRLAVAKARAAGKVIGFVPTMGALHAGHASLIDAAVGKLGSVPSYSHNLSFVVVSIFVNPTQFGPNEDLAKYPRTPEKDLELCREHGADLVFMPSVEEMYGGGSEPGHGHGSARRPSLAAASGGGGQGWPPPTSEGMPHGDKSAAADRHATQTEITVKALSGKLCGRSRPGHFAGVCTVVAKLFNIVQPDRAFFGAKDFQQAAIIRRMTADLNFPIAIVVCPTVREPDGLAISSRNAYLSDVHRRQAPALYQALELGRDLILRKHPPAAEAVAAMREHLAGAAPAGEVDYLEIVDPQTLCGVEMTDNPVVIAMAVRLGATRLIDNIAVDAARAAR